MTVTDAPAVPGRELADRWAITELTAEFGLRVDTHEWDRLVQLLAPTVVIDYSRLHGKDPITTDPAGVVGTWRGVLENLKVTQHLITGQVIELSGDTAKCTANLVAAHHLPNDSGAPDWTLGGRYEFALERAEDRWLITAVVLFPLWATGNRTIMQLAGSRNTTR
ncbi:nuclear transport factor 2 family protein [Amycolatopsis sp. NPDC051128]|uniref:nuclear transport factor 2 family protein n=1 Tax=Amycolatopsis sp. NPDC051128 TaxID=3155412 RepID=UPI0034160F93